MNLLVSLAYILAYTNYPETANVTDNNKRSWNQQTEIGCKYLSKNNLSWIKLIRRSVFTPYALESVHQ